MSKNKGMERRIVDAAVALMEGTISLVRAADKMGSPAAVKTTHKVMKKAKKRARKASKKK